MTAILFHIYNLDSKLVFKYIYIYSFRADHHETTTLKINMIKVIPLLY